MNVNLMAEDKIFDPIRTKLDDESSISDPRVQHLSYVFEETGETLPYALFVPSKYKEGKKTSLVGTNQANYHNARSFSMSQFDNQD